MDNIGYHISTEVFTFHEEQNEEENKDFGFGLGHLFLFLFHFLWCFPLGLMTRREDGDEAAWTLKEWYLLKVESVSPLESKEWLHIHMTFDVPLHLVLDDDVRLSPLCFIIIILLVTIMIVHNYD